MGDLYFQKIVIEEAPVYPAQITDLSIVAGERGVFYVDIYDMKKDNVI